MLRNPKQWQFLKKTAELGKTPHALLFYGRGACGKRTLALEFIKLLNCESKSFEARPCRTCRACLDIEKNTHPDLTIVEPQESKEIKIFQIRELQKNLSLKSYSAPFKTAIIDKAHLLNQEAQSAFLKMLEEPKGNSLFILISEYPEMLLPTILSRVERVRFYSPAAREKSKEEKEAIDEIIRLSGQNLLSRFQYIKSLAEDSPDLKGLLDIWLSYFREVLLSVINGKSGDYSVAKLRKILKAIQNISFLISTTNVNKRLALEILMLEL
ncbi:MAG: DNA polymerase III subunit [Candidatus Nealsonbacteria bacterium]